MHRFRLAIATRCLELPLRQSLKVAADLGAEGVQFDLRQELRLDEFQESARRDLLHLLEELGLRIATTTFTLRRSLADEHELDRRIAALKQAMSWSFTLKSRALSFRMGSFPSELDGKEARLLKEIFNDLACHANHVGVALAVQTSHTNADELQSFFSQITSGPIGLEFDPAQFALAKRNPADALRTLHGLIFHVSLRDAIADSEGIAQETPVGEGAVSWTELLATLGEIEYAGWLTGIRTQGKDRARDLQRAISSVRRLLLGG